MTAHASLARTGMAWAEIAELSASTWATLVVNIDCLGGLHTHTHTHTRTRSWWGWRRRRWTLFKNSTQLKFCVACKANEQRFMQKEKKTEISKATAAAESAYEVRKSNNRNCWKQVATIGGPSSELWWLSINVHPSPISRIPHPYAISPQPSSQFQFQFQFWAKKAQAKAETEAEQRLQSMRAHNPATISLGYRCECRNKRKN